MSENGAFSSAVVDRTFIMTAPVGSLRQERMLRQREWRNVYWEIVEPHTLGIEQIP